MTEIERAKSKKRITSAFKSFMDLTLREKKYLMPSFTKLIEDEHVKVTSELNEIYKV